AGAVERRIRTADDGVVADTGVDLRSARAGGLQVVVTQPAAEIGLAAALVDEAIVAAAAGQGRVGEHAGIDHDRGVARAGRPVDLADALEGLRDAEAGNLDILVASRAADMLDGERFVDAAAGPVATEVGVGAHVEVQHAVVDLAAARALRGGLA